MTAIDRQHPYLAPLLIKHGADINTKSTRGETPLMCAAYHNYTTPANMQNEGSMQSIPESLDNIEQTGETCYKAWPGYQNGGRLDVMKILISRGAELDTKDNFGQTALCKAIRTNSFAAVKTLLGASACVNTFDDDCRTPLHLAAASVTSSVYMVKLLVKNHALINVGDRYRHTPLCLCMQNSFDQELSIAKCLVCHGAIVQEPNVLDALHMQLLSWGGRKVFGLMEMILKAGLGSSGANYLRSKVEDSYLSFRDNDVKVDCLRLLQQYTCKPQPLTNVCRIAIRNQIIMCTPGSSIEPFIEELPLPQLLKHFLMFNGNNC